MEVSCFLAVLTVDREELQLANCWAVITGTVLWAPEKVINFRSGLTSRGLQKHIEISEQNVAQRRHFTHRSHVVCKTWKNISWRRIQFDHTCIGI